LLSDAGYIVFRNLELVSTFMPIEDASNFGLDAVTIVSDYNVIPGGGTVRAALDTGNSSLVLTWPGAAARAFQVERAREVSGPWEAISSIMPELRFETSDPASADEIAFYRVRQW
jgi:hypothetical protein